MHIPQFAFLDGHEPQFPTSTPLFGSAVALLPLSALSPPFAPILVACVAEALLVTVVLWAVVAAVVAVTSSFLFAVHAQAALALLPTVLVLLFATAHY